MTTKKAPAVFRMEPAARRDYLRGFLGRTVGVEVDLHRDGNSRHYRAHLLTIATPLTGAVVDAAILAPLVGDEGDFIVTSTYAVSVATIRSIRLLTPGTRDLRETVRPPATDDAGIAAAVAARLEAAAGE